MRYTWMMLGMAVLLGTAACKRNSDGAAADIAINGAGATFPYPLYSKWVFEYQRVDPRVHINYQSIGSGGGIRQITERTVDFGASDAPMSDAELAKAPSKLLHVPMTLGAVAVAYHLPGGVTGLKLTPETLAAIFLGEIHAWNDPKLVAENPGLSLPAQSITVVYRSDGSGTTAVFSGYLAGISASWKQQVGAGKSIRFPVGLGAKGNEGVAGQLKSTPGTLGYVELAYAQQIGLAMAALRNRAGKFVEPSLAGIAAAAEGAAQAMPDDLRVSIVDAAGESAYPLAAFSYLLIYEEQADLVKGKALAQFLGWALDAGQQFGPTLHYAPLPPTVVAKAKTRLAGLHAAGQALFTASGRP